MDTDQVLKLHKLLCFTQKKGDRNSTPKSTFWLSVIWYPQGYYFGAPVTQGYCFTNMVPLGVLYLWIVPLSRKGTLFSINMITKETRVPLWKKGTICSNSTQGELFWYPFFSECLQLERFSALTPLGLLVNGVGCGCLGQNKSERCSNKKCKS